MKFLRTTRGRHTFHLDHKERQMLFKLLGMYPLTPVTHHRFCKSEDRPEYQRVLEESLAEQRRENRRQITAIVSTETNFEPDELGYQLSLKAAQMESLLQALNDVRVGSWLALGSPDGAAKTIAALNEKTMPYFWAMETAGRFQMVFLDAMAGAG